MLPTFNVASDDVVVRRLPAVRVVSSKLWPPIVLVDVVKDEPENSVVVSVASSVRASVDTSTESLETTRSAAVVSSAAVPAFTFSSVPTDISSC